MPLTTHADQAVLNALMQGASLGAPNPMYVGLLVAPTWAASTAYTSGEYVVPSTFGSLTGSVGRIFVCTVGGTSGGSEPTWPTSAGGTVTDGGVTWTEVTDLFQAGTFTGAEQSGSGYARVSVAADSSHWSNATSAQPSSTQNSLAITFATPSATWGQCVGFVIADALSSGNVWRWGCLSTAATPGASSIPQIVANALTLTLE